MNAEPKLPSAIEFIDAIAATHPDDSINAYELELATIRACRALAGETADLSVNALRDLLGSRQLDERRRFICFMAAVTILPIHTRPNSNGSQPTGTFAQCRISGAICSVCKRA
jgi:hypothetical protein